MKTLLLFFLLFIGCSKEEKEDKILSKDDLMSEIHAHDSNAKIILPKDMSAGINCADYADGCLSGHTVNVNGLDMIIVEFGSELEAQRAAKRIKGFVHYNWVLDDVQGEPMLEKFAIEKMKAKKVP